MVDSTACVDCHSMVHEELKKHPAAWRAFGAWLHDPAVAYNTFPHIHDSTVGELRGNDN